MAIGPSRSQGASVTVQGAHGETVFSASAYDVPRFLTIKLDRASSTLRLEFGYPDKEEAAVRPVEKGVEVLDRINSGKLLGLIFRDISSTPGQMVVGLQRALDSQLAGATRMNQKLNYRTIKSVFEERGVQGATRTSAGRRLALRCSIRVSLRVLRPRPAFKKRTFVE